MNDFFVEIRKSLAMQSDRLSKFSFDTYLSHISKISQYRPTLNCSDIDVSFLQGYVEFMRRRHNSDGTIYRSLAVLRKFVNILRKKGLIAASPFTDFQLHRARSRRDFLEVTELKALYDSFIQNSLLLTFSERESMRAFLFSCFTGLRYADLKNLSTDDIKNGKIHKWTQKTGKMVYIPIPKQALQLIGNTEKGRVLHVVNNSSFNKNLKSGARKLGFNKRLHTHLARHTFATSCISLGIPIDTVSKLLGHSALQTTLIYANYVDATIDRAMSKFEI